MTRMAAPLQLCQMSPQLRSPLQLTEWAWMGHGFASLIWLGHTTESVFSTAICYLDPFWISKPRATTATCSVMNFYAPSVGSSTTTGPCTCSSHLNTRGSLWVEELLHPSSDIIHPLSTINPSTINHQPIHRQPSTRPLWTIIGEGQFPWFPRVPSEESCPSWRCRSWPCLSSRGTHQMHGGLYDIVSL